GKNLTGARAIATRSETSVSNVRINRNGTYLFVDVNISPAAKPGDYSSTIESPNGKAKVPFSLNAPLDVPRNFQGISNDEVIYLIMTDRFSDGDPSNNSPTGAPPGAFDRKNPRAYHGGDFRGLINHLPYFKELGATAIWLTPW